ncbi:WD40 repeat domain-containing protein [Thiotrichales bacterium HSG1]|nr:WD40 repeat domain-containing protein [Thiotrichales bacterium HSG1]
MVKLKNQLLPELSDIQFEIITPTEQPIKVLASLFAKIIGANFDEQRRKFEGILWNQDNALTSIIASLPNICSTPLVILIDQFEEIYTLCKAKERKIFIDNFMEAVTDSNGHLSVILTLRSDFLGETQRHEELNQIISEQSVIVPTMKRIELRLAIEQPAKNAGYLLENAVISLLIEQAKDSEGILPLLQFTLTCLWNGLNEGVSPINTLENIGGVGGALAQKAENIYKKLSEKDKNIIRRAFLKLLEPGTKNTRRRVNLTSIVAHHEKPIDIHILLNQFADKEVRLITLSENEQGQITVEITHEALLENWHTLKEWVLIHNEDLRFEHRLTEAVEHWELEDKADGLLWNSPDLEQLQEFHKRSSIDMTMPQMDFYRACENKKLWVKRKGWGTIVLIFLLLISIGSTYWAINERGKAQQERKKAQRTQSLFLADLARQRIQEGDMTNGILLALEALPKDMSAPDRPAVIEAKEKLEEAFSKHRERFVLKGYESMTDANFSPDGKQLITAGNNGNLYFWDVYNGKLLLFLYKAHTDKISKVVFSPDGKLLLTVSDDKTACLWDNNGKRLSIFQHQEKVFHADFSPNGNFILTLSDDNTVSLWNASDSKFISMLKHKKEIFDTAKIYSASFSPNNKFIVTTSDDGTARLWDSSNGKLISILNHKGRKIYNSVFSNDNKRVLTFSEWGEYNLWEISSGKSLMKKSQDIYYFERDGYYLFIGLNYDGKQIITISLNNYVNFDTNLWDTSNNKQLDSKNWYESFEDYNIMPFNKIALNTDGKLIWAKRDKAYLKNLTLERTDSVEQKPSVLGVSGEHISKTIFTPDGRFVATVSKSNTVRIWDTTTKISRKDILDLEDTSSIQNLIDNANEIVPRCLTSDQRKKSFLSNNASNLLIEEGEELAKKNHIDSAVDKFEQAKILESCYKFASKDKALKIAAYAFIENGEKLLKQDKIEDAIIEFQKAQEIDSRFDTSYTIKDLSNRIAFGKEKQVTSPASKQKYDKRNNLIHSAYFDETGNPITNEQYGFHSFNQKYDEQDNFLEFAVFDIAGNPTYHKDGYHKFTKKVQQKGRQIEWAYFDIVGNPITPNHVSYHKLVKIFDENGLDIEWIYFDNLSNLIRRYDVDGNPIKEE